MILSLVVLCTLSSPPKDSLAEAFRNPPPSARPHTWWHWMNGNVTKEGLRADLEAMKQVGIGGAQMFTVDQGIPHGAVGYNSEKWREMTAYAVQQASRLGLELCIHNCAGWSSSGGPWIKPENAMQVIAWSTTTAHGPSHFTEQIPPIKAPQVYAKVDYHENLAVYAFRTPTAEEKGTHFLGKTGVVREDGLQPDLAQAAAGVAIPISGLVQLKVEGDGMLDWTVPEGDWTILRIGYVPTGKDNHPAPPEGDGLEVDKLSRSALDAHWAGMMAKVIRECGPLAGKVLNNALIDSYEVGSQNWTPKMREEFRSRRGYDISPWLPVIAGFTVESREMSERFLWDLRRTIADLYAENYFGYFGELCHKAGMKFSTEPYGNGGFDSIQSGGKADIPMGEFWIGGAAMDTTRVAASIGHIYGRPVIGAESFTADDVRGKFLEEPYAIKALGDQVFCNGINRYIFHRYAAQPWTNLKPGMTMGPWGTHLERTQTWWTEAATWLKYVARCQYLLQQGTFAADILYYTGENSPVDWVYGPSRNPKPPAGHDYDSCDATILERLAVRDGKLELPSGMSYRLLVLPDTMFMRPAIARKIKELVDAGATVVGPKPTQSPSLTDYPQCDREVKQIADELWGEVDGKLVNEHALGKGKVIWGRTLEAVFADLKILPDFEFQGTAGRARLMSIHRRIGDTDVYFVSNQDYQAASADCTFRVTGKAPELWHADSGQTENAPVYRSANGRTIVPLNLGPAESVFVMFRQPATGVHLTSFLAHESSDGPRPPQITIASARYESADGRGTDVTETVARMVNEGELEIPASNNLFGDPVFNVVKRLVVDYTVDGKPMKQTVSENEILVLVASPRKPAEMTYGLKTTGKGVVLTGWKPGSYDVEASSGNHFQVTVSAVPKPLDLSTGWHVAFPPHWGAPPSVELDKLISWPDSKDDGIKYFSGGATYSRDFDLPSSMVGGTIMLDLGRVKNFATVRLNGKELAVLWKEPFAVDVSKALKNGKNRLEIKVTNLWPNRIIGDEQLPADVDWNGATLKEWPSWLVKGESRPKTGRYTFVTWKFWNKDSRLLESGLIGPITLRVANVQLIHP